MLTLNNALTLYAVGLEVFHLRMQLLFHKLQNVISFTNLQCLVDVFGFALFAQAEQDSAFLRFANPLFADEHGRLTQSGCRRLFKRNNTGFGSYLSESTSMNYEDLPTGVCTASAVLFFFQEHTLFWLIIAALMGLSFGSFLNVVIYRLPLMFDKTNPSTGMNLCFPRSHCPRCGQGIAARDNIPVVG